MPGAAGIPNGGSSSGTKRKVSDLQHGGSPGIQAARTPEGGKNGGQDGEKKEEAKSLKEIQSVMKMKAELIEKDRNNFLSAFEKPTQIYRLLRTRSMASPTFLQRNLSYMKNRMSRSHKARIDFKVDNLLGHKQHCVGVGNGKLVIPRSSFSNASKNASGFFHCSGPIKYYNIILLGISDGQMWIPETTANVDICIAKVGMNKRKEGTPGAVTKIFEKTLEYKMYSPASSQSPHEMSLPCPDDNQANPVISIPAELCSLGSNGSTVRSFKLIIRVKIRKDRLALNGKSGDQHQNNHLNNRNYVNNSDMDGPKAKRRRSVPTTKDRENFIYGSEATKTGAAIGDSDGEIVYNGQISLYEHDAHAGKLMEVDLDMVLKRAMGRLSASRMSHQRIRKEISWETMDEKHSKVMEQTKPAGTTAKVWVAVRTSSDLPPKYVNHPPPLLRRENNDDGAGKVGSSLARLESQKSVRIIYNFMYGSSSQQSTESRDDLRCPFCSLNCLQLYPLMKHLKLCHPRLMFTYSPIPTGAKIDVTLNDAYDGSYSGSAFDLVCQPPGEAFARNGPTKRTEVFSILVCRPKPVKQSVQEFFEVDEKDVDQRRTYITGHNRLYHHTSTCLPIHPREIDVDSEGEPDPEWLRVKTTMMIDEFTDVNEGEKDLMKLWNLHVMKHNYVGDCQIPYACKRFVELHGKELIQRNLYRNFCLHLTNLFDFGLLTPHGVHKTVQLLHSQMCEATSVSCREGWKPRTSSSLTNGLLALTEGPSTASFNFVGRSIKDETLHVSNTTTPPSNSKPSTQKASTATSSGAAKVSTAASSCSNPSTSHVNGVARKSEIKDDRSPSKKQTYFWLGGAYN